MKPTVRVVPKAITGSISGIVTNPENLPVAYAISGTDTISSTPVEKNGGEFLLAFLPEGSYTVAIRDTLNYSVETNDVQAVVGSDNDLGMITLQ